jgi:hypothetical protein
MPIFWGIAKKDRGNNRINDIVQHLRAKFSTNEFRQRFFASRWARVPEYFAKHEIFGFETNQARGEQATRRERRTVQATISQDVALRSRISRQEFVFEL